MRKLIFAAVFISLVITVDCRSWVAPKNEVEDLQQLQDIAQGSDILDTIIKVNKDNDVNLYEGDIALSPDDPVDLSETGDVDGPLPGSLVSKRNAVRSRHVLWKNKIIPYEIHVPNEYRPTIAAAIREFHMKSCLRFVPHTNEENWINFVQKSGCWSSVGMRYWTKGGQEISLGVGCNHQGVIMHELLHALGFWHEQSRPDRNQYIEVLWENIKEGKAHNFNKYSHGTIDTLKRTYDLNSIMHYGNKAFSKNGKPTILGIGPNKGKRLGQRTGFTQTDIFEINALYDCSQNTTGPATGWSTWSDFGPCANNCQKRRQRFCAAADRTACPGADKYGVQDQIEKCSNAECFAPVDGHWGRWSSWGQCSVTCGMGARTRTRVCNDPEPKNGGKACVGKSKGAGQCKLKRCGLGPDDCEFEVGMCSWSQEKPGTNNYRWYRHTGPTSSQSTGPNGDVSVNMGGKGYYVYAEASSPVQEGQVAKLQSKVFAASPKGRCMQFAYSMYGSSMGALNVYVIDVKNNAKSRIFSKSGDQGRGWLRANATIVSNHDYKVSLEVTRGKSFTGDIALDDIMFTYRGCHVAQVTTKLPPRTTRPTTTKPTTTKPTTTKPTTTKPTTTKPTTTKPTTTKPTTTKPTTTKPTTTKPTTTKPTTTKPTTTMPTTSKPTTITPATPKPGISLDCDFEQDMCQWKAVRGSNSFNWMRHANRTRSSNTGPYFDHTTGKGYYVYMETSWQAGQDQTAYLSSPVLSPSYIHCLTFYYHMYGKDMGSLNVYIQNPRKKTKYLLFSVSGDQGEMWHYQEVPIVSTCRYQVVFEGVRGTSWLSDIALDDIMFNDGLCF